MGKTIEPNNIALLRQLFYGSKDGILISSWIHTGSTLLLISSSLLQLIIENPTPPHHTSCRCQRKWFSANQGLPVKTKHHVTFLHGKSVVKFLVKLQQNVILTNLQNNEKKRKQKQQQLDKVNHIWLVSPEAKSFGCYGRSTFNRNPMFAEE